MKKLILLTLFSLCIMCINSIEPGIKLGINPERLLIPLSKQKLSINTTQETGATHIDFIGWLNAELSKPNFTFTPLEQKNFNFDFSNKNKIGLSLKNVSSLVDFNYLFQSGFYNIESKGNLTIKDVDATIKLDFTQAESLISKNKIAPLINLNNITLEKVNVTGLNFSHAGGLENATISIFGLLDDTLDSMILKAVPGLITNITEPLNAFINNTLTNLPLEYSMKIPQADSNISIDYSATGSPYIVGRVLQVGLVGGIHPTDNKIISDNKLMVPDVTSTSDKDVKIHLGQYVTDSLFDSLYVMLPGYTIKDEQIKEFKIDFSTWILVVLNSEYLKNYPENQPMGLNIKLGKESEIKFLKDKLNVSLDLEIGFTTTRPEDHILETPLVLNTTISILFTPTVDKNGIFNATYKNEDLKVWAGVKSSFYPVDVDFLNYWIQGILSEPEVAENVRIEINKGIKYINDNYSKYLKIFDISFNEPYISLATNFMDLYETFFIKPVQKENKKFLQFIDL
jgi:hypothetical protein